MKILLTVHQFLPDYSAGTEVLTHETAKELVRLGHEVSVLAGHPALQGFVDTERFENFEYDGIPIIRFHHSYVPMGGQGNTTEAEYNNWLVAAFLRKFLRRKRPDLVHFFHLARLSASVIDVCHELSIPMVLTPTDFWFLCPTSQLRLPDNSLCQGPEPSGVNCLRHVVSLNQPAAVQTAVSRLPDFAVALIILVVKRGFLSKKWFFSQIRALSARPGFLQERINLIDRVLAPTRLMKQVLLRHGLRSDKVAHVPYGINLTYLSAIERKPSQALRLGFIGTLFEHKGAHVLIRAVRSLPERDDLQVKIYGRLNEFPAYVSELRALAAADARIQFCGTFPNHEIGKIFSELDALIVPSLWYENTPLVVYSAQAARVPVIASNTPGLAEVIAHDVNGLLFEPGNAQALANLLQRASDDRELLPRLAANAPPVKSVEEYAKELNGLYRELLAAHPNAIQPSMFSELDVRTS